MYRLHTRLPWYTRQKQTSTTSRRHWGMREHDNAMDQDASTILANTESGGNNVCMWVQISMVKQYVQKYSTK